MFFVAIARELRDIRLELRELREYSEAWQPLRDEIITLRDTVEENFRAFDLTSGGRRKRFAVDRELRVIASRRRQPMGPDSWR